MPDSGAVNMWNREFRKGHETQKMKLQFCYRCAIHNIGYKYWIFTAFRQCNRIIILALVAGLCQNPIKPVTIHTVTSSAAKSFSKAFTKHNTEHGLSVTRIYALNRLNLVLLLHRQILQSGNNQTTMPLQTPGTKELPSVMSMKVSLEIIRLSTKDGRTGTGRSKSGEDRILTSTPQNRETDNPASIRNIHGKHSRREVYRRG